MNAKHFVLATLAYVLVSFALGFGWHLLLFREAYQELGVYTREPPLFALGLTSMVLQGMVLAYLYPLFNRGPRPWLTGIRFGLVMGLFLWSVAVLAHAAKSTVSSLPMFFTLSSAFHLIQFVAAGALIGWIHGAPARR